MKYLLILLALLSGHTAAAPAEGPVVDHRLEAWLDPGKGSIRVVDHVTLPHPVDSFEFLLHGGLEATLATPGALLERTGSGGGAVPAGRYRIRFAHPSDRFELRYRGSIQHKVDSLREAYAGGRESSPGLISPEGVFLAGSSAWYPYAETRVSFSLATHLPAGWRAVSQGVETPEGAWKETLPQDDIYLVAAPYTRYERRTPLADALVYLRRPDDALAERYLAATERYLGLFSRLIGPYPYRKFALVENFWESGYGMPSFTLLGSRVIRLPFILHSSYPHEILHNWWGNSVYIDHETGNWAEGLTAYLADHLVKEQSGAGAAYRRDTLQSYANYVDEGRDFPLTRFRGRHGQVSQAVGYGKTAMLFHMLRLKLGDEMFRLGLRRFYEEQRFRTAGFGDIQSAFESVSGADLGRFFNQWTTRVGAPRLAVENLASRFDDGAHHLRFLLVQAQSGEPFDLDIPLFVQVEGEATARQETIPMRGRNRLVELTLDRKPLMVMVDPRFDLFRRLDRSEIPPSLGRLFAADRLTVLLPSRAPAPLKEAYRRIADRWRSAGGDVQVAWDDEIARLPEGPLWLFGADNLRLGEFPPPAGGTAADAVSAVDLDGETFPFRDFSFAITLDDPGETGRPVAWMNLHAPEAAPGFARKIVHYRKYSYALFRGERPTNVKKGQWPLSRSALSPRLDPGDPTPAAEVPGRPPLAGFREKAPSNP